MNKKQKYKEARKDKYHNRNDEQKQKMKEYKKEYRKNMTVEQNKY